MNTQLAQHDPTPVDWSAVCRALRKAELAEVLTTQATNEPSSDTTRQLRLAAVTHGVLDPIDALHDAGAATDAIHTAVRTARRADIGREAGRAAAAWEHHLYEVLTTACDTTTEPDKVLQIAAAAIKVTLDQMHHIGDLYDDCSSTTIFVALERIAAAATTLDAAGQLDDDLRYDIAEFLYYQQAGDEHLLLSSRSVQQSLQQLADLGIDPQADDIW